MEMIRCSIMRGGTSKGIFIMKNDLPTDQMERERVILSIFGSPDIRQIDGLGGADLLTSKLAIISPSTREDADVDYTFAQVGLDKPTVDIKGNCGNIASAVGPFAINTGLVEAKEPVTIVRIHLTNSKNLLVAEVPVKYGKAAVEGDFSIAGVPGTGAKITLDWKDAQGAFTGKLLPTGNVKDIINVDGKEYAVSILDIGNPLVFIKAEDIGIDGRETPKQIEGNMELMNLIEQIRGMAAVKIGMVENWKLAATESAYAPFFAIVSPSKDYTTFDGKEVKAEDIDLVSRLLFMQKVHKNYPVTSTVSTGVAAKIPGTVVSEVVKEEAKSRVRMNIGHPAGCIPAESIVEVEGGSIKIVKGAMYRTARPIMDGYVYVRKSNYNK
ncbi:3-methylitaconate isomerase [Clostridium sp. P21]|uniref:3-methylitaconate isomerase n=2 Tax=Clostridium muellerianum TaxID=2716538 RepID=A0A7Y0HLX4_9CLOT|nr:3-methylitaconate isomerase [Clostridium muellerianum]